MRTAFRKSFERDLKRIKGKKLLSQVQQLIEDVEEVQRLEQIKHIKKISGASGFYRIRIGDYRVGIAVEKDLVEFVRILHRREIYRYFP